MSLNSLTKQALIVTNDRHDILRERERERDLHKEAKYLCNISLNNEIMIA